MVCPLCGDEETLVHRGHRVLLALSEHPEGIPSWMVRHVLDKPPSLPRVYQILLSLSVSRLVAPLPPVAPNRSRVWVLTARGRRLVEFLDGKRHG